MINNVLRSCDIKNHNRYMVLSYVYNFSNRGGISQAEVVSRTGLKAPSVFRIFSNLEQDGLIYAEHGSTALSSLEKKKGRHPVFYKICPDACYIVSVEFWSRCISLGLFNFEGRRIYSEYVNLPADCTSEETFDGLVRVIKAALKKNSISKKKIFGIGVAAPGQVDLSNGSVVYYGRIKGMRDYPLKEKLEQVFNVDIVVHNNCCAMAYYTYRQTQKKNNSSVFTYLLRGGVNGSLVSDNKIYTTADNRSFEAGHIPLMPDGPKCWCGSSGCLQSLLDDIDKKFRGSKEAGSLIFSTLAEPLSKNDERAVEAADKASSYLYVSMKQIRRTLAPDSFQIICSSAIVAEYMASNVRKLFQEDVDNFFKEKPSVFAMAYDNLLAQEGMFYLVLNKLFEGQF